MSLTRRALLLAVQDRVRFDGVWCAELRGKRFTELSLVDTRPVAGTMRSGVVRTDAEGYITGVVAEVGRPLEIKDVSVNGRKLRFSTQEDDDTQHHYELRITQDGRAELTVLSLPLRPFALRRVRGWGLA